MARLRGRALTGVGERAAGWSTAKLLQPAQQSAVLGSRSNQKYALNSAGLPAFGRW